MINVSEALLEIFKNERRLRIIKYLLAKGNNPREGAYISEIGKKLNISKGTAFVNLSELERAGILVHTWELKEEDSTKKAVKVYHLSPKLPANVRGSIEKLVKEL